MVLRRLLLALVPLGTALVLAGCGGSGKSSTSPARATSPAATTTTSSGNPGTTQTSSPGALQAEANSSATGDIPDNQVFLVFRNSAGGWSMKYPEGWAQRGSGDRVSFRDKNNIVRVVVTNGKLPTVAGVRSELAALKGVQVQSGPKPLTLPSGRAVKVVYTTASARSPVTGKHVTLAVDRYYLAHGGKEAIVDLGTPQGVDNVDAYRLMIESFRWR